MGIKSLKRFFVAPVLAAWLMPLGACAPTYIRYSNVLHPNNGQVQFNADWYACEKANSHPEYFNNGSVAEEKTVVDGQMAWNCMSARGWQEVTR